MTALAAQSLPDTDALLVSALKGEQVAEREALIGCLAAAHCAGVGVDWRALLGTPAGRVPLPTYAFQHERYWLAPTTSATTEMANLGLDPVDHPVLGAGQRLAGSGTWVFSGRLSLAKLPWLSDHVIAGSVLLPGTAFVELALAAADRVGAGGVEELTLVTPLVLDGVAAVVLQVLVEEPDATGGRPVSVFSRREGDEQVPWVLHASGVLGDELASVEPMIGEWPPDGAGPLDVSDLYARLVDVGYEYGRAFQGVRAAWRDDDLMWGEVGLGDLPASGFVVHPALLDAALHVVLAGMPVRDGLSGAVVPFSFSGVRVLRPGASLARVRVERLDEGAVRVVGADRDGGVVVVLGKVQSRVVERDALGIGRDGVFVVEWVPVSGGGAGVGGDVVVLGGGEVRGLRAECIVDGEALVAAVVAGRAVPEVAVVRARERADLGSLVRVVQVLAGGGVLGGVRLVVVCEGALAVGAGELPDIEVAAVPGLMRSAQLEFPGRVVLVDVDGGEVPWGVVLACGEPEVAVRGGVVLVPRLVRAGGGELEVPRSGRRWRLEARSVGSLEGLALGEVDDVELGAGEVRVAVHAAGLNFRDVVMALGLVEESGGVSELGGEGAGVVVEVADDVTDLRVGDRVCGLMSGAFGPRVVTDRRYLVRVPDGWSFAQAASVPIVFLTAYYALCDVAGLRSGERLLVHGAAGGVGMAAVQLAAYLGAELFATAHPRKWGVVRERGVAVERIASSRSLEFRERFLAATGGAGVDVVLDSLAGEFVDASLDLAAAGVGGRFVEIGKTDVRDPGVVAGRFPGVRYRAFDLAQAGPDRIQAMLRELVGLFERGVLEHLPVACWDVRRAPEAFRFMREARHVGKIVLTVAQPPDRDGTVLITGATGGLGVLVARHLAGVHGARQMVLASRHGERASGATELVAELAGLGCKAELVACDVADPAQVRALVDGIAPDHPVSVVVHAAGVLDDGVIEQLDPERLERVLAPKVDGAINLAAATRAHPLCQFVLFSSIAGTIGSPGQANYAAANAFLDGCAVRLRAEGVPAVALAWGPWETGMGSTVSETDRARWTRQGVRPLTDADGLALFDHTRASARPALVAVLLPSRGRHAFCVSAC